MSVSLPKSVLHTIYAATGIKYVNFVSATILVYDIILTMPEEIKYIWRWEWGAGKILYMLTRYSAFLETIVFNVFWFTPGMSVQTCKNLFTAGCWSLHTGIFIGQMIVIIRTYAIWGRSRVILVILLVLFLGIDIPTFFILRGLMDSLTWAKSPFPSIAQCFVDVPSNRLFINFTLIMLLELLVVLLTAWKAFTQRHIGTRNGMLGILYRDGFMFFLCLFTISLVNFIIQVNSSLPHLYIFLLPEFQRVIHSVLTSKIILHLRQYTRASPNYETVTIVSTIYCNEQNVSGTSGSSGSRTWYSSKGSVGSKVEDDVFEMADTLPRV
ncbi:hypothetical protein SCHPADRAFT_899297 [Schizopora paradoxa]|uniref:DUF6533 domain-containing protein n=1 Tax=Schizopora paradoxa TaxID=27342 RepID=A0A0H2S4D6_9AGAM|nr:hypothetical protein SCHPADRAFT_899297 [Schizopora paradoxa]